MWKQRVMLSSMAVQVECTTRHMTIALTVVNSPSCAPLDLKKGLRVIYYVLLHFNNVFHA